MFAELHAHSAYSFLDGASLPEELAIRASELGYDAVALTDHDGVCGSLEFALAAKAFGVRPITGAEVTLADGSRVTLLVESATGTRISAGSSPPRTRARECLGKSRSGSSPGARSGGARAAKRRARLPVGLCPQRARGPQPERGSAAGTGFRPRPLLRRAAAAVRASGTRAATPPCGSLPRRSRWRPSPRVTCTPTRGAGGAAGRPRRSRETALRSTAARRSGGGTGRASSAPPAGEWRDPLPARPRTPLSGRPSWPRASSST